MLHVEKKLAKIVEELTLFFFGIGGSDIQSSIIKGHHKAFIFFKSNYNKQLEHKLDDIEDILKGQKNEGMEDIYWELVGSGDPGEASQLWLIGIMVDEATIIREEGSITIKLCKYLN